MSLTIIKPSSILKPYVIAFWDYENLFEGDNVALSILPDTATYLCFLYAELLTTAHKQQTFTTRSGLAGFQSFRSDLGGLGNVSGCQELNRANGNDSILMLAQKLGLSKRTLERRFQLHIGTTPKKYARIVRLRNALFQRQTLSSWADVAYFTGYYDQSHMINDFQELYGLSPELLYPQIETSKTIQFSGLLNLSKVAH